MSQELYNLENSSFVRKNKKLLGRGVGCKRGKTCGRGHKGQGSRSGSKQRYGYEGGQVPLYRKVPRRGFSNVRFALKVDIVSLSLINRLFNEGDTVSVDSLIEMGLFSSVKRNPVKVLNNGTLDKVLHFSGLRFSTEAKDKLLAMGCSFS